MAITANELGFYVQKPAALDVFSLDREEVNLTKLYDYSGYCIGIVLYSETIAEDYNQVMVWDLRIDSHVPIKDFLRSFALIKLSKAKLLRYYKRHSQQPLLRVIDISRHAYKLVDSQKKYLTYIDRVEFESIPDYRKIEVENEENYLTEIGNLYLIFMRSNLHLKNSVAFLAEKASLLQSLKQYRIFYDDKAQPVSLISWAWLDESLLKGAPPLELLHPSRWTEGENLCVCDILGLPQKTAEMTQFVTLELATQSSNIWVYPTKFNNQSEPCTLYRRNAIAEILASNSDNNR